MVLCLCGEEHLLDPLRACDVGAFAVRMVHPVVNALKGRCLKPAEIALPFVACARAKLGKKAVERHERRADHLSNMRLSARYRESDPAASAQIGRASCRERVYVLV